MKFFRMLGLVSVISACVMFIAGCADDEDIVTERSLQFTKQLFEGNPAGLEKIATPDSVAAAKALANMMPDVAKERNKTTAVYTVVSGTVNEDRAIVKISVTRPNEKDAIVTVPLQKLNDEWKVIWTKTNGGIEVDE